MPTALYQLPGRRYGTGYSVYALAEDDDYSENEFASLLAEVAARSSSAAAQIRLGGLGTRGVQAYVIISASEPADCQVVSERLASVLQPLDAAPMSEAELRRSVEVDTPMRLGWREVLRTGAPLDDRFPNRRRLVPPWQCDFPQVLHGVLRSLGERPGVTFVMHAEGVRVSSRDLRWARGGPGGGGRAPVAEVKTSVEARSRSLVEGALRLRFLFVGSPAEVEAPASAFASAITATREGDSATARVVSLDDDTIRHAANLMRSVHDASADATPTDAALRTFTVEEAATVCGLPAVPAGGLPGVASRRTSRLRVASPRVEGTGLRLGRDAGGQEVRLSATDLQSHMLVGGVPGAGKTTTVQGLLRQAWTTLGVPFLVVDPAKRDYRPFFADIQRTTRIGYLDLGPSGPPFNPFAVPGGADPLAHGDRVAAAIDSATHLTANFAMAGLVLRQAVTQMYVEIGDMVDGSGPSLAQLYRFLRAEIFRHPAGEVRSNLEASLDVRIAALARATTGDALLGGPRAGLDWAAILDVPTLIEMRGFPARETRSLVFGLVVAGLITYREAHAGSGLQHVAVIEEAHRLLGRSVGRVNATGEQANEGAVTLGEAIAEQRGLGQSYVIVDQAPGMLVEAVVKNLATRVSHRLTDGEEIAAMSSALNLNPESARELGELLNGEAVLVTPTEPEARRVVVDAPKTASTPPQTAMAWSGEKALVPVGDDLVERQWCAHCPAPCKGSGGLSRVVEFVTEVTEPALDANRRLPSSGALVDAALTFGRGLGLNELEIFCAGSRALALSMANTSQELDGAQQALSQRVVQQIRHRRS